ncbi:MAG: 30S ribosomal protein S17e [archaeon]
MGRIKTKVVKRTTLEILESHHDQVGKTFEHNKELIKRIVDVPSKKIRNNIIGYLTRKAREEKEI